MVAVVLPVLLFWSAMTAVGGSQAKQLSESEFRAVRVLRTYASAEATYQAAYKQFASLEELIRVGYLEADHENGSVHHGYRFRQVSVGSDFFEFAAEPAESGSGQYSFNVVSDYLIRFAKGPSAPRGNTGKVLGADTSE